jgi:hypothetical protein
VTCGTRTGTSDPVIAFAWHVHVRTSPGIMVPVAVSPCTCQEKLAPSSRLPQTTRIWDAGTAPTLVDRMRQCPTPNSQRFDQRSKRCDREAGQRSKGVDYRRPLGDRAVAAHSTRLASRR